MIEVAILADQMEATDFLHRGQVESVPGAKEMAPNVIAHGCWNFR